MQQYWQYEVTVCLAEETDVSMVFEIQAFSYEEARKIVRRRAREFGRDAMLNAMRDGVGLIIDDFRARFSIAPLVVEYYIDDKKAPPLSAFYNDDEGFVTLNPDLDDVNHDQLIQAVGGDADCDHEWEGDGGCDENPGWHYYVLGGNAHMFAEKCEKCALIRRTVTHENYEPGDEDYVEYSFE